MKKGLGKFGIMALLASVFAVSQASAAWSFTSMLNYWASIGVFAYILPFLLIFALVYGILSKTAILGENNAVNAIIALALGLLALVGDYVPNFFQKIAPNLGIALSVLLAAMILGGLFMKDIKGVQYGLLVIAGIAFVAVLISSFSGYPSSVGNIWDTYGPALITLAIIVAIVGVIIGFSGTKKS